MIIFIVNISIKQNVYVNKTKKFVRIYLNIALVFASFYSLAGAIVH